jgi:hypothetical protein
VFRIVRLVPLIAAVAVAGAVPAVAPAAKKKVQCVKRSGDTVYRDSTLRVIQTVKRAKGDPDASTVSISFCRPGTTRAPVTLTAFDNTLDGSFTLRRVTRGGSGHVALELDEQTGTTDATNLFVYDLASRTRTFAYASEVGFEHHVTGDGGVALLEAGSLTGFDASGQKALGTAAAALAGSGNVVYWSSNGTAHAATLGGAAKREFQPSGGS